MLMPGLGPALQALDRSQRDLERSAGRIAASARRTPADEPPAGDPVRDVVSLQASRRSFELNLAVIRAADATVGTLVDRLA